METKGDEPKKDKDSFGIPSCFFTPRKVFSQEVASSPLITDLEMDAVREECGDLLHTAEGIIDAVSLSPLKTTDTLSRQSKPSETPNTKKDKELRQLLLQDLECSESELDTPAKSGTPSHKNVTKHSPVPSGSKDTEASTSGLQSQSASNPPNVAKCTPVLSEESSSSSGDDLDVYSSKFDANKALSLGKAFVKRLPYPNTKKLNNLAQYKVVAAASQNPEDFERNMINALKKKPLSKKCKDYVPPEAPVPLARNFLPHQMPVHKPRKEKKRNLLDRMESAQGPLAKLVEYRDKKIRVMVKTRNIQDGTNDMVAYIAACDKHWNLALTDVEETFIRKKKRKVPVKLGEQTVRFPDSELARRGLVRPRVIQEVGKRYELCKRYIPQLMIRGEQIVVVFPII